MAERKTLQDLTIKDNFMFGAVMMDEEICRELLELVLGFRIAKVTLSKDEVPAELVKFLKYVKAGLKESSEDFQDSFVKRVQTAVRNVKASREMEEQYMLLEELIKEEREQALAEGRELGLSEGRELGLSEGRELGLTEGISQGQISSILELLSYLGEVPEEIKEAVSEENDPEVLKLYLRQAAAAKSMDDFGKFLKDRKSKVSR